MSRRAAIPITGPTGDAASRQRRAQDALGERNAMKRAAALRDPGTDTSRETASRVKRGGNAPWVPDHRDAVLGTRRTT